MLETIVRDRGLVTLPQQIREQLKVHSGDHLLATVEDGRIVLIPATLIPKEQAWFWEPEWQAGEREADAEILAGLGDVYMDDQSFLDSLR